MAKLEVAEIAKKMKLGLEELLKPGSRVLYENVFSTRHIGRVIDFLIYENREFIAAQPDPSQAEYRIRQTIELSIFNAWANFRKGEKSKCVEIEMGWDGEKLIVAVAHYVDADVKNFTPGSVEPVSNETAARMQKMLEHVQALSDGLLVRHEPQSGRVQALAFVSSAGGERLVDTQCVIVDPTLVDASPSPDAAVPDPLASADIAGFVEDEKKDLKSSTANDAMAAIGKIEGADGSPFDQEVIKVKGGGPMSAKENDILRVKGSGPLSEEEKKEKDILRVKGSGPLSEEEKKEKDILKVKGGGPMSAEEKKEKDILKVKGGAGSAQTDASNEIIRVKHAGDAEKIQDDAKAKLKASSSGGLKEKTIEKLKIEASALDNVSAEAAVAAESANDAAESDGDSENQAEEGIQTLLDTVKTEMAALCPGLNEAEFEEAFRTMSAKIRENYNQTLHHMLRVKNIQMISKTKHLKDQVQLLSARIDELKAENQDLLESLASKDANEAEILRLKNAADANAKKKRDDEEAKARETIAQYQAAIEKGEVPTGAKDWGKGLLEAALKERAFLSARSREIEAILKKREYDYRNKETMLKEEVRIKDEELRQKEFALVKTKEALSNAMQTVEQTKKLADTGSSDKNELVHKLATAERLLTAAKDNNERMTKRVEDVQKKWQEEFNSRSAITQEKSALQRKVDDLERKLEAAQNKSTNSEEIIQLTQARDKSLKIIDDLKKQIKELQSKLIAGTLAQNKGPAGQSSSDSKKKGDAPMGDAEAKHKLDQANKLTAAMKEELERTKKRFEELKQSETKLRVEVAKLQADLKAAGKNPAPEKAAPKPQKTSNASPLIKPKNIKMGGGGGSGTGGAGGAAPAGGIKR